MFNTLYPVFNVITYLILRLLFDRTSDPDSEQTLSHGKRDTHPRQATTDQPAYLFSDHPAFEEDDEVRTIEI